MQPNVLGVRINPGKLVNLPGLDWSARRCERGGAVVADAFGIRSNARNLVSLPGVERRTHVGAQEGVRRAGGRRKMKACKLACLALRGRESMQSKPRLGSESTQASRSICLAGLGWSRCGAVRGRKLGLLRSAWSCCDGTVEPIQARCGICLGAMQYFKLQGLQSLSRLEGRGPEARWGSEST